MEFFGRHSHDRLSSALQQFVSLSLSQASIPEIYQKCAHFAAFTGASAKYLGESNGVVAKKRGDEWKKE
jgi:hypothetical protein